MNFGFKDPDPAHTGFQSLENLSTAYWYSQVLFTGLELNLFHYMETGLCSANELAREANCHGPELHRLLRAMERMGLVTCQGGNWYNAQVSSLFLVPGKKEYMGDFFLYRQYMRPQWEKLTQKVSTQKETQTAPPASLSYEERNLRYVASTDTLVRQKSKELVRLLQMEKITGPILDIGGGAGSLIRALQAVAPEAHATLFDIPDVIEAARTLYPDKKDWKGITPVGGDFRTHKFDEKFSVICMSNFLHAYGPEAKELLQKAVTLLGPDGILVIHDYFPDRKGSVPQKGALYDLTMMLNTFNGVCHDTSTIVQWLGESGIKHIGIKDLSTDTAVIMARKNAPLHLPADPWTDLAMALEFEAITPINPKDVITAPWVNAKCQFGCKGFGKNLQCPPMGMAYHKTRQLLDDYTTAFLVKGAPPGRQFHEALLSLEKKAFLKGFHKAFVFGAGPCPVCPQCPEDGKCRHHDLARPAMEGSGIDVYTTVANAGWSLSPVQEKGQYVTYIGLFLVE